MAITRPYRRTCRMFTNGHYNEGGHWRYLLHKAYASDPRHYVRAFLLIQADMLDLFSYVEPSDKNLGTYSHRIQQLLMRTCVEIEANLTAILLDNKYPPATQVANPNLNMLDYRRIERSHRLSSYEVRIPTWQGDEGRRRPFHAWSQKDKSLKWYQAYNVSKHNRHENFSRATFDALIDSFCGLSALLASQFYDEDYSPAGRIAGWSSDYSYDGDDGMEAAIGDQLRVRFPTDWPVDQQYEFDWEQLKQLEDPFQDFNHAAAD